MEQCTTSLYRTAYNASRNQFLIEITLDCFAIKTSRNSPNESFIKIPYILLCMLDKLFNRKEIEILQARIKELEPENKSLSTRLSKQEVRTKKAVSDRQEASLALKKAEEKIDNLKHTLDNLKEETK